MDVYFEVIRNLRNDKVKVSCETTKLQALSSQLEVKTPASLYLRRLIDTLRRHPVQQLDPYPSVPTLSRKLQLCFDGTSPWPQDR